MVELRCAMVLHDLNNLLMVASAWLDEALPGPESPEARARQARMGIRRAVAFLRDEIDRTLRGGQAATPRAILELVDLARVMVPPGVTITASVPSDLPPLALQQTDADRVLLNLVLNAAHAIGPGGHIEVSAGVEGRDVLLAVRDDGPGMPAGATRPRSTNRKDGCGLGLAAVEQVVEEAGGQMEIIANRAGTSVQLWIPREKGG